MLLQRLLDRLVRLGDLTVIDSKGRTYRRSGLPSPDFVPCVIRLHDPSLSWKLALHPNLAFGEAYMNGTLTIEEGGLYNCLALLTENIQQAGLGCGIGFVERLAMLGRRLQHYNPVRRSRANVAHHYDLSSSLYDLFLDADRQYSCAYFPTPGTSLEEAQAAKKRHLAAKLMLKPGQKVLDIGSGWGGLALTLARMNDVDVTGITLSEEQLKMATDRVSQAHFESQVRFRLEDYRQHQGRYDRIVSVGMFEHVGTLHYREYFSKIRDLLAEDGVAVIHSIGRADGPGQTNAWIRKYIFPGGYIPALSEVFPAIERSGLIVTDVEILRLHYADTLKEWARRFQANRSRAAEIYDERFCRMWEFYLAGCEATFRHGLMMVFQIQLSRRIDTVPLTRDYIYEFERVHKAATVPQLDTAGQK